MTESDRMRELAVSLPGSSVHPSPSSADVEALVCAVVYVGDQLARIVAALESPSDDDIGDDAREIGERIIEIRNEIRSRVEMDQ